MRFQRKGSRIKELHCRVWVISQIGFRARRNKERNILAPHGKQRRFGIGPLFGKLQPLAILKTDPDTALASFKPLAR
jgi:hypothetical protein